MQDTEKTISDHGYTDDYGPNVALILKHATRVVRGKVPLQVRRELQAAVKAGVLGRLAKDGLKPEIYFHPSHLHGAVARQKAEAAYTTDCIARANGIVLHVRSVEERVAEAMAELTA
jgi:hypothetical protein